MNAEELPGRFWPIFRGTTATFIDRNNPEICHLCTGDATLAAHYHFSLRADGRFDVDQVRRSSPENLLNDVNRNLSGSEYLPDTDTEDLILARNRRPGGSSHLIKKSHTSLQKKALSNSVSAPTKKEEKANLKIDFSSDEANSGDSDLVDISHESMRKAREDRLQMLENTERDRHLNRVQKQIDIQEQQERDENARAAEKEAASEAPSKEQEAASEAPPKEQEAASEAPRQKHEENEGQPPAEDGIKPEVDQVRRSSPENLLNDVSRDLSGSEYLPDTDTEDLILARNRRRGGSSHLIKKKCYTSLQRKALFNSVSASTKKEEKPNLKIDFSSDEANSDDSDIVDISYESMRKAREDRLEMLENTERDRHMNRIQRRIDIQEQQERDENARAAEKEAASEARRKEQEDNEGQPPAEDGIKRKVEETQQNQEFIDNLKIPIAKFEVGDQIECNVRSLSSDLSVPEGAIGCYINVLKQRELYQRVYETMYDEIHNAPSLFEHAFALQDFYFCLVENRYHRVQILAASFIVKIYLIDEGSIMDVMPEEYIFKHMVPQMSVDKIAPLAIKVCVSGSEHEMDTLCATMTQYEDAKTRIRCRIDEFNETEQYYIVMFGGVEEITV